MKRTLISMKNEEFKYAEGAAQLEANSTWICAKCGSRMHLWSVHKFRSMIRVVCEPCIQGIKKEDDE